MSRSRYRIFEEEYPYFLTDTIAAWLPIFTYPWAVDVVLDSWRWLQREREVEIFGYVVMENHLHWIARGQQLADLAGRFKSYSARRIIDELNSRGGDTLLAELQFFKKQHKQDQRYQLWQEGSYPKQIKDDAMMLQKLEYMHNNPLRRGYVDEPAHWRYSSARNYAGKPGLIEVITHWN
jgi:putative transposase